MLLSSTERLDLFHPQVGSPLLEREMIDNESEERVLLSRGRKSISFLEKEKIPEQQHHITDLLHRAAIELQ